MNPVIAIPTYDGTVMACIVPELERAGRAGIDYNMVEGQSLISRARSHMATALHQRYSHIVWVDADVVFTYEQVHELLRLSALHNAIVSGFYPKRSSHDRGWCLSLAPSELRLLKETPENMSELTACGFGFVVTPSWVFPAMAEHFDMKEADGIVPYFLPMLGERGEFWGEDYSFCARARKLPIVILAARNVVLAHRGMHDYRIEDTRGPLPRTWEEQRALEDRWHDARPLLPDTPCTVDDAQHS